MEQSPVSNVSKGLVIALIIILLSVVLYFSGYQENSNTQYLLYAIFLAGIIWSCISYGKQLDGNVSFGNVFAYGFKVSAVVALVMIAFVLVFSFVFPEMKERTLEAVREKMATNPKITPEMVQQTVEMYTKWFRLIIVAGALFSYVFMGLIASLIGAALTKRKPSSPFQQQG